MGSEGHDGGVWGVRGGQPGGGAQSYTASFCPRVCPVRPRLSEALSPEQGFSPSAAQNLLEESNGECAFRVQAPTRGLEAGARQSSHPSRFPGSVF